MATVVDVEDDGLALAVIVVHGGLISNLVDVAEAELGNGAPNEEITRGIATVFREPAVQGLGGGGSTVNGLTAAIKDHGD